MCDTQAGRQATISMCDTWVDGYGYGLPGAILGQAFGHSAVITTAPPYYIIMLGKSKTYRFFTEIA